MAMAEKIDRFLKLMQDRGASDLHLSVGRPPMEMNAARTPSAESLPCEPTALAKARSAFFLNESVNIAICGPRWVNEQGKSSVADWLDAE